MITSRNNEKLKAIASLAQGKHRKTQGLTMAEGIHIAQEAFGSGVDIKTLVVSESMLDRTQADELIAMANDRGAEVLEMTDGCYQKLSTLKSPEGVCVVMPAMNTGLNDILTSDCKIVACVGVQDPGNAGAIVRVAEAAGADGCVFLDGVDVNSPKFIRASMGGAFRIGCVSADSMDFLRLAKDNNVELLAADSADAEGSACYTEADYSTPAAICMGSEGAGVGEDFLMQCSQRIYIPMSGKTESLNVAVAAGIILYQARSVWVSE